VILAKSGDTEQLLAVMFFIGASFVYSGVKRLLKVRRIQDTARNSIAHAPQGNAEIEAFAWCLNEPIKNANGEHCAYYRIRLEEYVRRQKNSSWEKRWEHTPHAGFIAVDMTGAVIVFCNDAEMQCHSETTSWSDVLGTQNKHSIVSLVETGYGSISTGFFGGRYRVVEEFLTLGSPCYVQGNLVGQRLVESKAARPFLNTFFAYLHKRPPGQVHLNQQYDKDADGTVTDKEAADSLYTVARNIIEMDISSERLQKETALLTFYGQIAASPDHPLIVGAMHEHHLVSNVSTMNLLRIIGGALLMAAPVAYFLHFHFTDF
jgi:hypothetical protein